MQPHKDTGELRGIRLGLKENIRDRASNKVPRKQNKNQLHYCNMTGS